MSFTTRFFKPAWQRPDPDKRKEAVKGLSDLAILKKLAIEDESAEVRRVAVRKILDDAFLVGVVRSDRDKRVQLAALANISGQEGISQCSADANLPLDVRIEAIRRLNDQPTLQYLALNDTMKAVRIAAVEKVTSPDILRQIEQNDRSNDVTTAAHNRLEGNAMSNTRAFTKNRNSD